MIVAERFVLEFSFFAHFPDNWGVKFCLKLFNEGIVTFCVYPDFCGVKFCLGGFSEADVILCELTDVCGVKVCLGTFNAGVVPLCGTPAMWGVKFCIRGIKFCLGVFTAGVLMPWTLDINRGVWFCPWNLGVCGLARKHVEALDCAEFIIELLTSRPGVLFAPLGTLGVPGCNVLFITSSRWKSASACDKMEDRDFSRSVKRLDDNLPSCLLYRATMLDRVMFR